MALIHIYYALTAFAFLAVIILYFIKQWDERTDALVSDKVVALVFILAIYLSLYFVIVLIYLLGSFFLWLLEL